MVLIAIIVGVYFISHFVYSIWILKAKSPSFSEMKSPVSIIVAARNEEKNIRKLLDSLISQNFPSPLMEIIVGDDSSEDETLEIAQSYARKYSFIQVVSIQKQIQGLKGKQNVLAQLIPMAKHEKILITDADIQVKKNWVSLMSSSLDKCSMVSAPTIVRGSKWFHHFQSLEWIFSVSVIKPFSDWGLPITAVGNNMGFWKKDYLEIGGYEQLPFSLTEDYILFEKIVLKGNKPFLWFHDASVLNISEPIHDLKTFFHQHKRWYEGAKKGPWYAIAIFIQHIVIYPAILIAFFLNVKMGAMFLAIKIFSDLIWTAAAASRLKQTQLLWYFFPFQIYFLGIMLLMPWYFWLQKEVIWKNRNYST